MIKVSNCQLCPPLEGDQKFIFETETCLYLYLQKDTKQTVLEGSGLIAQNIIHKRFLIYQNSIGWNTGRVGCQSIPHAQLHIIPRFKNEQYAGKGIRQWIKQPKTSVLTSISFVYS